MNERSSRSHSIIHKESDENPQLALGNQNTEFGYSILPQVVENDRKVVFTYDVSFKESDIIWASRWDTYLLMNDDCNHWFYVTISMLLVILLSGMIAMIVLKTVHRDVAKNQWEIEEEILEETRWKIIHGDQEMYLGCQKESPEFLCVYVGSGVQIFATTLVTIIFGLLGFLSPIDLGGCRTAMVVVWIFMGLVAGYSDSITKYNRIYHRSWITLAFNTLIWIVIPRMNSTILNNEVKGIVHLTITDAAASLDRSFITIDQLLF